MKKEELPVLNRSILEVRSVLQDQLARLNQDDVNLEKEHKRSMAIATIATQLINSAKIEADLMIRNKNFKGTGFFDNETKPLEIGNGQ